MHQHFLDANGNYFVAIDPIETPDGATAVPARPDAHWNWDGQGWVEGAPLPAPVPDEITFAQLLIGLVTEQWISEFEGEQWLQGVLPPQVTTLIESLPQNQQFAAKARASRPSAVLRMDPLVVQMGAAQNKTPEEIDQFFRTYAGV